MLLCGREMAEDASQGPCTIKSPRSGAQKGNLLTPGQKELSFNVHWPRTKSALVLVWSCTMGGVSRLGHGYVGLVIKAGARPQGPRSGVRPGSESKSGSPSWGLVTGS